jgi:hypothetical protein
MVRLGMTRVDREDSEQENPAQESYLWLDDDKSLGLATKWQTQSKTVVDRQDPEQEKPAESSRLRDDDMQV